MMKVLKTVLPVLMFVAVLMPSAPAAEPHPRIHAALESLRSAKASLQAAPNEFHGHRASAMKHIDEAIAEAEICMRER
ncbi:MAG TPA: hypothetical protein VH088_23490 [Terriglobales bacterium]|jgi:hypothetical protein|nr:hypothetical protein [Terriglobales bacterium]